MTTDKELLELAAKAAGVTIPAGNHNWNAAGQAVVCIDGHWRGWNPLADDGDALRLAVKLGLYAKHFPAVEDEVQGYPGFIEVWQLDDEDPIYTEYLLAKSGDVLTATRRCIVRAAAELGKAKP